MLGSNANATKTITVTFHVADSTVAVESVAVEPKTLSLKVGETGTLTATVAPENATNKTVTWTSNKTDIATVSDKGVVTAVAAGEATITVTTEDGSKTAECTVTVTPGIVAVTGVTLDKETLSLNLGADATLRATIEPADATNKNVAWTSSDETVATVDQTGKVTATDNADFAGKTTTITVTTEDGNKTAKCAVTVNALEVVEESDVESSIDETALYQATQAEKDTMNAAKDALDATPAQANGLAQAVSVSSDGSVYKIEGDTTLEVSESDIKRAAAGIPGYQEGQSLLTLVVPKLTIEVANAKSDSTAAPSLTFKIEAFAVVKVSTASKSEDVNATNSADVDKVPLSKTSKPIEITLPLPSDFFQTLDNPFVKHTKGSDVFWHKANKQNNSIKFTNRRGFSNFEVMSVAGEAAIEGTIYNTLQEAINAVGNNGKITVLVNTASATVSREVTFTITSADDVTANVTIASGAGYEKPAVTENADGSRTYTIKKTTGGNSSGGGGGGGGGGGSSKPAIKPGDKPTTPGTTAPSGGVAGFNDVAPGAWYADSVKYVVEKGLFGGVGNGRFAPNDNMTRAMMWTVLARYMGVNTNTGSNWYEAARTWAMEKGISDGTMADGNVTREQFVTMLWRLSGEPTVDNGASFTDSGKVSGYAKTAVDWAVAQGIVNGYSDGTFKPQGSATRAEVAKMLTVFCQTEQSELAEKVDALTTELDTVKQTESDARKWIDLIQQYANPTELTAPLLNTLIEKILVHQSTTGEDGEQEQEIEIFYRFIGKID